MDPKLEKELSRFRRYRDELIHADSSGVEHHVREFVRELGRNELVKQVRGKLPPFDVENWWKKTCGALDRGARLEALDYPDDEDDRLVAMLDLVESMASDEPNQISVRGFGQLFGKYKSDDATALAQRFVIRPLAELLGDRIREAVEVANPAVRELAGVPLDRIPKDNETRIFLSHKSENKELIRPFYDVLTELGFNPWLDEKAMKAGDTIHREIASGFDEACAVVFFVTEQFKDERWLKREVDHAVNRKIERGDRFAIITLVYGDAEVPRPLKEQLWVPVKKEVDALREVLRALPIQPGPVRWRR